MPFGVIVTGISRVDGEDLFRQEPVWWNSDWLRKDSRFRQVDLNQSYYDYIAELSVEEVKQLHEHFLPVATEGVYQFAAWQERIQPIIKVLEEALYQNADLYAHFKVHVFEWESGF